MPLVGIAVKAMLMTFPEIAVNFSEFPEQHKINNGKKIFIIDFLCSEGDKFML